MFVPEKLKYSINDKKIRHGGSKDSPRGKNPSRNMWWWRD